MITLALTLGLALSGATQDATITAAVAVDGDCRSLTIRTDPAGCGSTVINTNYSNGRTSFAFESGDTLVVFSGGDAQTRTGDSVRQPLDRAMVLRQGQEPAISLGEGACTYGNPYAGSTTISCAIMTADGMFGGTFITDGSEPRSQQF